MQMKKVWSMILVAAIMLSFFPSGIFSVRANATAENVYEDGYTWAFDQTVALGATKGLVSGDAAETIKVMNHEGYNSLTPNRAIADGVLTTEVAKNWNNTVGHGVFYKLPAALEAGRIYQLSLNLYGGNDAAAMNGIAVSFDDYTDILTDDGGVIQKWQDGQIAGMHNADTKLSHSISGNLPTEANNTVEIEFIATDAMAAGGWMLVSFPLEVGGSYQLGNVTMDAYNYDNGYTWAFDKTVEAFGNTSEFKTLYYGNEAKTVGIINHEVNANYGTRSLTNGVLSTVVTAGWDKAANGVYYKLPAALEVGRIYRLRLNLYGGNDAAVMNGISVSFGDVSTTQQWQNSQIEALHNAATKITRSISGNLPTEASNTVEIEFVATDVAASNWMLISFPLAQNGSYQLGSVTMEAVDYEDGYTWKFDKTVDAFTTATEFKKLYYGNESNTVGIVNHEGYGSNWGKNTSRSLKNGLLTSVLTASWGEEGHGVYYRLPAELVVGQIYRVSMNLYAVQENTPMTNDQSSSITVSFNNEPNGTQEWQIANMENYHNANAKFSVPAPTNLSTQSDNVVSFEFVATQEMVDGGSWMLITFPMEDGKTYILGNTNIQAVYYSYADGYTWAFDKTIAFTTDNAYKVMQYGNMANTVGIVSHSAYASYGTRSLSNGILTTNITSSWAKGANGLYYKLPLGLTAGQEYVVSMNLYASAEGTALVNGDSTSIKLSFSNEIPTEVTDKVDQYWTSAQIEGIHNAETQLTYRAPEYLSTDTANKVAISFVATQAMVDNGGWMLISMPLAVNGEVNLGAVTLKEKKNTDNHFLNGDFSNGLTGWMTNHDSSYVSVQNSVLNVSDKVPTGDVKLYQAMYLEAGIYRLSFDVLGAPTSWRPVYFMGTALDNSSVTGSQLQVSMENGKTADGWWTVTRDVTIETAGTYYFQMNLNQVSSSGTSVAPQMQYDNFALYQLETVTITWKNDDGTVLEEDVIVAGTTPEYNGEIPTKEADSHNSYRCIGWDKEITSVFEDTTYIAQYEVTTSEHSWGEGEQTKAPTCTEAGEMTYTCSVCGQTKTEAILPNGEHSYDDGVVTKAPTCGEDGEMTYTCSACGESYTEAIDATGEHSYEDGVCTVCGEVVVKNWNIVLSDDIGVNFALALAEDDEVQVNVDGKKVPVELIKNEDGTYQVLIEVAAAQMTSEIQIVVNGQPVEKTYSVRAYADVILNGNYTDEVKTLVKNMLVYGGAAQNYFKVNKDDLANLDITVAEVTVPSDELSVEVLDQLDGINFYGASMVLRSKTAVRFYFTAKSVEGLTFTVNGNEYKPDSAKGMYYVEVADINPQALADVLNMVVTDGVNNLEVSYSPVTYISRMYHKSETSEQLKAVVKAMYGYHLAAKAYIDNL